MRSRGWLVASIAIGVACFTFTPIMEMPYSCVYCRVDKVDFMIFGINVYSTLSTNECSRWYSAHIERSHSHLWAHGVHAVERNLFGVVRSTPLLGHIAINRLSSSTQLRLYKKFSDPTDVKPLLKFIAYDATTSKIRDDNKFKAAHLKAEAILEWERSGFPGTWDDWWNRYFAEHKKFWGL